MDNNDSTKGSLRVCGGFGGFGQKEEGCIGVRLSLMGLGSRCVGCMETWNGLSVMLESSGYLLGLIGFFGVVLDDGYEGCVLLWL